ncbi:Serine/threonine-protein kinase PknD [uncultured archaeon]|nr:Serine/threonine-protein kinase PknD [uncultured archaeon]
MEEKMESKDPEMTDEEWKEYQDAMRNEYKRDFDQWFHSGELDSLTNQEILYKLATQGGTIGDPIEIINHEGVFEKDVAEWRKQNIEQSKKRVFAAFEDSVREFRDESLPDHTLQIIDDPKNPEHRVFGILPEQDPEKIFRRSGFISIGGGIMIPLVPNTPEQYQELVSKVLGDKYFNIELASQGAQSLIFKGNFAGPEGRLRSIKVDKTKFESSNAQKLADKGYGTKRHIETLSTLPDAEDHHIVGLIDYFDLTKDHGVAISVHQHIEGKTLEKLISEEGKLSSTKVKQIFSGVLDAVTYYTGEGYVHRDLNPANILVRPNSEAFILDFCNSGKREKLEEKVLPTAGARRVMDPLLIERITGEKRAYSESSEVYSLGQNLYFALTGKYFAYVDPEEGTIKNAETEESYLDESGKINTKKYQESLYKAINDIHGVSRSFKKLIGKSLSLEDKTRYKTVDEFTKDFKKKVGFEDPESTEKTKNQLFNRRSLIGILAGTTILGSIGAFGLVKGIMDSNDLQVQQLETKIAEAEKYEVVPGWDGFTLGVNNNLSELNPIITKEIKGDKNKSLEYLFYPDRGLVPSFFTLNRGDTITIYPKAKQVPRSGNKEYLALPSFPGQAYFEGWEPIKFSVANISNDPSQYTDHYPAFNISSLTVPKDMPDGVYNLIIEYYAYGNEEEKYGKTALSTVKFRYPEKVLSRKRFPVVVGNPESKMQISMLRVNSCEDHVGFGKVYDNVFKSVDTDVIDRLDISLIGKGLLKSNKKSEEYFNPSGSGLWLPYPNKERNELLQIAAYHNGKIATFGYFPIKTVNYGRRNGNPDGELLYNWKWDFYGPDHAEKLVEYRKELFKQK